MNAPLLERFRDRLPVSDSTPLVSIGEGSTPLLRARGYSERLGIDLWLKWEGPNPTGSFKDRGMTVAVAKAVEAEARAVICASTGNTAASAAAYAAHAGLTAVILQPAGAVALGKLVQARASGARLLEVRGSFDQALAAARELANQGTHALVNSLNPNRLEGQKTAAFEILEDLGGSPDALVLPYGGGGNTSAYYKGFAEAADGMPRIFAVEAVDRQATMASAIRITEPVHADEVEEAVRESMGAIVAVSDSAVVEAWLQLAREEGIFCEPSSAAGLAALKADQLEKGSRVVCVITGHGLKDPEAVTHATSPPIAVEPDPDAIAKAAA